MRFATPPIPATLVRRYKRFLADVVLPDGSTVTAHCPNPGSMMGLDAPGSRCWLSLSDKPGRKLPYTLEIVEADRTLVGINTGWPNRLAEEAIRGGVIPSLAGYASLRREVRYGVNSRVDLLLEDPARPPAYVEIKNVHLLRTPGLAEFPDCVTSRGAKHLVELAETVRAGNRAVMLFVVQRDDCTAFAPAADIDPAYAKGLDAARAAGVEVEVWSCRIGLDGIDLYRPISAPTGVDARVDRAGAAPI